MPRPICAIIHLHNIKHNLSVVRQLAGQSKIWSVVKADGYGHGLKYIWPALKDTDGFALLDFHEAVMLREEGWKGPILLLEGFFKPEDLDLISQYDLTTCVHIEWQLAAIERAELASPIAVYVKLNSGMNRLGFSQDKFEDAVLRLKSMPNVRSVTLMSHFANSDNEKGVEEPLQIIKKFDYLSLETCIANSGAILWYSDTLYDWVRPGIVLYGASPRAVTKDVFDYNLKAAMTLQSEIIAIQDVEAGQSIGYGSKFTATKPMRVATVACGYADGYPHHMPSGSPVLCNGQRCELVGAISMDTLAIDITDCEDAQIGTHVELWGENLPIDDMAYAAGTASDELMIAISLRVPIVYQNNEFIETVIKAKLLDK